MNDHSTAMPQSSSQFPGLRGVEFAGHIGPTFHVEEGGNLTDALKFASDLNEGLGQLLKRVADDVNDGEVVDLCEMRALCFIAGVSSAVTRAAQYTADEVMK